MWKEEFSYCCKVIMKKSNNDWKRGKEDFKVDAMHNNNSNNNSS